MDKLTSKIIKQLNQQFRCPFFTFSKEGLTIKLSKELKEFFEDYEIENEVDFDKNFDNFRDFLCIPRAMDLISFCLDNDKLYPNHFGMTNAPLFGFNGFLGSEELPVEYAFMYFNKYQVQDWLKELKQYGKVCFETFIDNQEVYYKAYEQYLKEQALYA